MYVRHSIVSSNIPGYIFVYLSLFMHCSMKQEARDVIDTPINLDRKDFHLNNKRIK